MSGRNKSEKLDSPQRSVSQFVHYVQQNVLVPAGLGRRQHPGVFIQIANAGTLEPQQSRVVGIQLSENQAEISILAISLYI